MPVDDAGFNSTIRRDAIGFVSRSVIPDAVIQALHQIKYTATNDRVGIIVFPVYQIVMI